MIRRQRSHEHASWRGMLTIVGLSSAVLACNLHTTAVAGVISAVDYGDPCVISVTVEGGTCDEMKVAATDAINFALESTATSKIIISARERTEQQNSSFTEDVRKDSSIVAHLDAAQHIRHYCRRTENGKGYEALAQLERVTLMEEERQRAYEPSAPGFRQEAELALNAVGEPAFLPRYNKGLALWGALRDARTQIHTLRGKCDSGSEVEQVLASDQKLHEQLLEAGKRRP